MKFFIATKESQGTRSSDFCHAQEGELVGFAFECDRDRDDPDGPCGCKRSLSGLGTHKGTTTFKVVNLPMTRIEFAMKIAKAYVDAGWYKHQDYALSHALEDSAELIRLAKKFDVGHLLEKRGDNFQTRTITTKGGLK